MQDEHGVDVNLLLFCCWMGVSARGKLQDYEFIDLFEISETLNDNLLNNLRSARKRLKEPSNGQKELREKLREDILACELQAEKMAQNALYGAMDIDRKPKPEKTLDVRLNESRINIESYFDQRGLEVSEDLTDRLVGELARFGLTHKDVLTEE